MTHFQLPIFTVTHIYTQTEVGVHMNTTGSIWHYVTISVP